MTSQSAPASWAGQALCSGGTVASLLEVLARTETVRVAVRGADGSELTYGRLYDRAVQRAGALAALGLRRGDRVAALMQDGPEYVELYAACAVGGFVVAPCNAAYRAPEIATIVQDARPRAVVHSTALAPALPELPAGVVVLGSADFERLATGAPTAPVEGPRPDDLLILGYTSGTTGRPKGAMLTHRTVLQIARLNAHSYDLPAGSVAALTGSMSFVSVVPAHIISHFGVAGTVLFPGEWSPESLPGLVREHAVTFTYAPSPYLLRIAAAFAADPDSMATLVTILHSGSRAAPEDLAALVDAVGGRLVEGWGLTENSGGLVTAFRPGLTVDPVRRRAAMDATGRAAEDTEVEVVDEQGDALAHDGRAVGELIFRSPALFAGYWDRPAESAEALRGGWFHSGDLGTIDGDGLVRIADRRTDLIVTGGINVYPTEVENCIRDLAGVAEVCVVGLPHPRWGSGVAAAVVRDDATAIAETEILEHCRVHMASFKKPVWVFFVDELPRTSSLKLSRAALRDRLTVTLRELPSPADN